MFKFLKLAVALAGLVAVTSLARPPRVQLTHAQSSCATAASVGSLNGDLSIDSAVQVTSSGCSAGTTVGYWVYIPGNSSHPANWYEFAVTAATSAWLDLNRNEAHPTEFPPGTYQFAVCGNVCAYSSTVTLGVPTGTAGGGFNPWGGGASNMQWNRHLCENNGSCDPLAQIVYGFDLGFTATANNTGDSNDCPGNCLYQNLNTYFTSANPDDTNSGFTQLVINHHTSGYSYFFATFSNNVVYCRTNSGETVTSPGTACDSGSFSYDGLQHAFWASIAPAQQCKDVGHQCLQVYDDGGRGMLAEERMWVNGGALNQPFVQNESYTTDGCSVWGAQLNYADYSMLSPCAMNNGLSMDYPTDYAYYQTSESGGWGWLYNDAGDAGTRYISNQGNTNDVYCGGLTSQFPSSTSMQFGTLANAHPCVGGSPT